MINNKNWEGVPPKNGSLYYSALEYIKLLRNLDRKIFIKKIFGK